MEPNPADAQNPAVREQLSTALRVAAAHLRERGNRHFLNDEPKIFTTFELAALIDHPAHALVAGSDLAVKRLWGIFAPTCAWDDAGGDSRVGEAALALVDTLYRPGRGTP